jgi:predicted TIM-barrel fold metal-dependent hydrolase
MTDIKVFEGHFHCQGSDGAATVEKWLDSGELSGILCCTDLSSNHEDFEGVNAPLLALSARRGRDVLPLLAMVHPNRPGWQEHASRWFDAHPTLVGIKLHPPISKYRITSELIDPVFDFANERNLCVASHTTPIPGQSAADFHDSLVRRRETKFIIYHASTHEQSAYLATAFRNVYVEPTWLGFFPHLFQLTRKLGGWEKLIGGTDGPGWFGSFAGSPYADLAKLARQQMGDDEDSVRAFCGGNLQRLLAELG